MSSAARLLAFCIAAAAWPAHGQDPVGVTRFEQYVADQVGVIPADRRRSLEIIASDFEAKKRSRVAALIVHSALPETPDQLARRVAKEWKIDDGAILLIAMNERAIHIESGATRGITEAQAEVITARIVAPMFKSAKPDLSVELGLRTIMEMIEEGPRAWPTIFSLQEMVPVPDAAAASERASKRAWGVGFLILAFSAGGYVWWRHRRRAIAAGTSSASVLADEAGGRGASTHSTLALVAVNCIPIWGVVIEGWAVFPLFVLFWFEILILSLVNGLRIVVANSRLVLEVAGYWLRDVIFAIPYGLGITSFFSPGDYDQIRRESLQGVARVLENLDIWWQVGSLAAVHVVLFLMYIGHGEHRAADVKLLGHEAFMRLLLLHLAIFSGGILASALGSPVWALVVLVLLKTWLEVWLLLGRVRVV